MRVTIVISTLLCLSLTPLALAGNHHVCTPNAPAAACVIVMSSQRGVGTCDDGEAAYSQGNYVEIVADATVAAAAVHVIDGCSDYESDKFNSHIQTLAAGIETEERSPEYSYHSVELVWQDLEFNGEGGCDVWIEHQAVGDDNGIPSQRLFDAGGCPAGQPPVAPALP